MSTIFTRIINGEIPGTFVHRDDRCVVFMSINPMAPGHCLVVPREEIDQWTDLGADLSAHLFSISAIVGSALKRVFECERIGLIIAGYEVPHCHVHLIPTRSMADMSFANAAASVAREQLEAEAESIREALRLS